MNSKYIAVFAAFTSACLYILLSLRKIEIDS
ncbi:hypothetical protein SAMN05446037_102422 [Anaerovirgula multivorans]|uniref:Uncharacterized protein n=1 Tax=Anaerovirgula multivorans TaxID=312168 RepID=A0A239HVP3_9FIRM|nr:hypothetical protein SAMN05446037_102422 [Anaerovirgula multivorans]